MKTIFTFLMMFIGLNTFAQIPTNGLVAYYPFNGNANDLSGNGHNGTVNGATLTTDRFGNANSAYSFDGNLNYITANIGTLQTVSVSLWFNSATPIQWYPQLTRFGTTSAIEFIMENGTNPWYVSSNSVGRLGSFSALSETFNSTFNQWYHVTVTYNSSTKLATMYINGIFNSQVTLTTNLPTTNGSVYFGNSSNGRSSDGGAGFKGILDDIRIYNRALSQSEVQDSTMKT